eukprot:1421017-Lingulodinium_polyedra.AAC.1
MTSSAQKPGCEDRRAFEGQYLQSHARRPTCSVSHGFFLDCMFQLPGFPASEAQDLHYVARLAA